MSDKKETPESFIKLLGDKVLDDGFNKGREEDDFVVVSYCGEQLIKLHLSTLDNMGLLDLFFMNKLENDSKKIKEALHQLEAEMKSGKRRIGEPI